MCAVSMVYDYGQRLPYDWWNKERFSKYERLIKEAERFDEETNQPDCEDASKAEFMKNIIERLERIEEKLNDNVSSV